MAIFKKRRFVKRLFRKIIGVVIAVNVITSLASELDFDEIFETFPDMIETPVGSEQKLSYPEWLNTENKGNTVVSNETLHVEFLDVGQGDSILIYDENDNVCLIDTGVYDEFDTLSVYLRDEGIYQIDYLVLTHPDADHIGSASLVIENYDVTYCLVNGDEDDTVAYLYYEKAIDRSDTKELVVQAGFSFSLGEADCTVIAPDKADDSDKNGNSIVIRMVYGESSFLFMGDATGSETDDIWHDVSADVYKASHHGSANDGCNEYSFIDMVDPDYAVISCELDNSYGHPHKETMAYFNQNKITTYRTDYHGKISCITDGNGEYSFTTEK